MTEFMEYPDKPDAHMMHNWQPLNTRVDEEYHFVSRNIFARFFGMLLTYFAFIVLYPLCSILFGIRVKGRKHLRSVKKGGILIANHVHPMDGVFLLTHGTVPRRPYIVATKGAFDIPVVRRMIKLMRAVPVPETISAKKKFVESIDGVVKKNLILIFPEAAMWPYYDKLRPFKLGAFSFAVKNNVPLIPACVTFRPANKFYRFFGRKKPLIAITFLPPIAPDGTARELKDLAHQTMAEQIERG